MGWVQLFSLVSSKKKRTTCVTGPKGEARIFKPHAPSGPYIQEVILPLVMVILDFLTIPWLGPKDAELRGALVAKAKLAH